MSTARTSTADPRQLICELSAHFYGLGWVSGTGGGVSVREGGRVFMAPSGVQKERMHPEDIFELDMDGEVVRAPVDKRARVSACAPLFYNAFRLRGAGAVIHSHSMNAMLATLIEPGAEAFQVTHLEMMKGIRGTGYHDTLTVPIIPNTAHECDLADSLAAAIEAHPDADAVLVERHGVYVWGRDWAEAKTQAECYDYLFEAAVRMRTMGIDAATAAPGSTTARSRDAAE